jgi:AcrR family transcriptional regulator
VSTSPKARRASARAEGRGSRGGAGARQEGRGGAREEGRGGAPSEARGSRVPADEARRRILDAARSLLRERSFAELTVGALMQEAGLARTVFYRHFDDLPDLAPELLPDSDAPLIDEIVRQKPEDLVAAMVDGLVDVYARHGRLLRAIDDAARHDPEVAERLEVALAGPRELLTRLLTEAPHPPEDPAESQRLLMATHRAYLLDTFGPGEDTPQRRAAARAALLSLWERLLA